MNKRAESELAKEIDQIIGSINIVSEPVSSGFAQRVMERIANESIMIQRVHRGSLLFLRSIAAAVIVLIGINFYTIISIHQNAQQTISAADTNDESVVAEVSEYDSFSLLAQDY